MYTDTRAILSMLQH